MNEQINNTLQLTELEVLLYFCPITPKIGLNATEHRIASSLNALACTELLSQVENFANLPVIPVSRNELRK